MQPQHQIVIEDYAAVRDESGELEPLITRYNRQYLLSELDDKREKATYMLDLGEYVCELEAKNAALKERMKLIMFKWGSNFSAGYDAGYALAKFDYGIHEDTAERLLSPEEIADIGTLPANAPTILEILDEDRGDVEDTNE